MPYSSILESTEGWRTELPDQIYRRVGTVVTWTEDNPAGKIKSPPGWKKLVENRALVALTISLRA